MAAAQPWAGGNAILGGWQLTNIFQARSGDPLTMAYSPNNNTEVSSLITISGRNAYRPNLVPGVAIMNSTRAYNTAVSGIQYLNNATLLRPTRHRRQMRRLVTRRATAYAASLSGNWIRA